MTSCSDTRKLCRRYTVQTIIAIAVMSLAVLALSEFANIGGLKGPLVVSAVFAFTVEMADILIWQRVRRTGQDDALSTFYTAVSGFRMLLALAVLGVCYFVIGREAMPKFCLVFLAFYAMMIIHHSLFFMHRSGSGTKCGNDNK